MKILLMSAGFYLMLLLASNKASSQIIINSGNNYDSSIVIKTDEYWNDIYKKCTTSTFIMQKGGMQEVYSDGGMFGCGLLDSSASFSLGDYEYKIWSTEDGVLYMLIKDCEKNKYIFRRLFSKGEETYKVVSVENKIDKVFRLGLSIR